MADRSAAEASRSAMLLVGQILI